MLTGIMTARLLGPEGKGAFALINLANGMLVVLGCLGIQQSIVYFIGRQRFPLNEIVANVIGFAFIFGIFIGFIFLVFFDYLSPLLFKDIRKDYFLLVVGLTPIGILATYFRHVLLGKNKITVYNLLFLVKPLLLLVSFTAAWLIFRLTLLTAVVLWFISFVISEIIIPPFLIARLVPIRLSFNPKFFKEAIKFGSKTYATGLVSFFNARVNIFIIGYLLGLADIGYYSVAVVIAGLLWRIPSATSLVLFPRVASASKLEANQISAKVCRNTLAIVLVASVGLILFGKFLLVMLYGSQYLPAIQPLYILLIGTFATSISQVLSNDLIGRGRPEIGMYATSASLIATISLDFALIPQLRLPGAALAFTISQLFCAIVILYFFVRISGNSIRDTLIIKVSDIVTYLDVYRTLRYRLVQR